ncbi:MAG: aspartyl protease family protein [Gemmatimonadetes bacterium]|nr:aspartyl protease family protein [Gemmatimonadota bacterium]
MGEIIAEVELENAVDHELVKTGHLEENDVRRITVRAIVDTGAMMLTLPKNVVDQLGIGVIRKAPFTMANGAKSDLPIAGPLSVRIGDRGMFTSCVVVDEGAEALVGQIVLEELDLLPDPTRRTLGPRHPSEEGPLLRL